MRPTDTFRLFALTALLGAGGAALAREKPPLIYSQPISCLEFESMEDCIKFCSIWEAMADRTCYIKDGWAMLSIYDLWIAAGEPGDFEPAVLRPGHGVGVEVGETLGEAGGVLTLRADAELLVSWESADGAAETLLGSTVEVAVFPGDRVSAVFNDPEVGGVVLLSLR